MPVTRAELRAILDATGMTYREFGLFMGEVHPSFERAEITMSMYFRDQPGTDKPRLGLQPASLGIRLALAYWAVGQGIDIPVNYKMELDAWLTSPPAS